MDPEAFLASAQRWHDFYLLTGGAAATLTGLMFVAVSFGAGLMSGQNLDSVRAFIDPPLTHFVHVIVTASLMVMPTMTPTVFGALLLLLVSIRLVGLVWVYRHYRRAHREHGDMETSDWMMGIWLPVVCFMVLLAGAIGFLRGSPSFTLVAGATLGMLMIGVRSAWELMVWLAVEVVRRAK